MQEDVDLGASAVVWSLPERQKKGEDVFGERPAKQINVSETTVEFSGN